MKLLTTPTPRTRIFPTIFSNMLGAPEFVYPFFPQLASYGSPGQSISGWTTPTDSLSPRFFRLPVVDITTIQCTPRSVGLGDGVCSNPRETYLSTSNYAHPYINIAPL